MEAMMASRTGSPTVVAVVCELLEVVGVELVAPVGAGSFAPQAVRLNARAMLAPATRAVSPVIVLLFFVLTGLPSRDRCSASMVRCGIS